MKIKFFTLGFSFVLFLAPFLFSQSKSSASLIGRWESTSSIHSRKLMIELKSDSSFIFQTVLAANYSYKIVGDKMITRLKNEDTGKFIIDTMLIKLKPDTLISIFKRNGKSEITTMVRINKEKKSGVRGKYTWKYPNGRTAFSEFTSNGLWIFRLPIRVQKGKYSIDGNILTFNPIKPDSLKFQRKFWFKGKLLIFQDTKTDATGAFKKVSYFPEN